MNKFGYESVKLGGIVKSVSITSKLDKERVIFLNTSDIFDGNILVEAYTNVNELPGQAKKTFRNNDILFSEIRPLNKRFCFVQGVLNVDDYVASTKLMVIRVTDEEKYCSKYIYYFLTSKSTLKILDNIARQTSATFPQITFSDLKELKLLDYPLSYQQKIASVLSVLDDQIELNNKINQELEEMAQTLYNYWFVQFEFPNEEGKPYKSSGGEMVWNEELKREVPEGWEVKKLGELFLFEKGKTPNEVTLQYTKGFYPYLTIEALNFGVKEYVRDGVFVSDEVVMVMDGAASGTVYQGESGILGSTLCKLNINHEKISNELFYFILKAFESEVKKRNVGSTIPHANKNFINSIKISIPTDENILNLLNDHLQEIKNSIGVNRKTNSTLIQLRDYLLPLLMNGQVGFSDEDK